MYNAEQLDILTMIKGTAQKYGMKAVADRLGIHAQTAYSDMDPNNIGKRSNKLGFLHWLLILDETGDLSSLDAANRLFNRISLPIPKPTEEMTAMNWMEQCATSAKESGEAVAEMAESILDGKMEYEELQRCEQQTLEALEAFAGMYLTIKEAKAAKNI